MKKNIERKNSNISSNNRKKENYNSNNNSKDYENDIHHDKNNHSNMNDNTCNCNYNCNCNDDGSVCYCLDIRKASQRVTKLYSEALNPIELTITQFGVLKHIQIMAPVNVTNLAREMSLDRTTLVRSIKILEKKGFIDDISENRTRNRKLILSKLGNEITEKATVLWNAVQKRLEEYLGKKDLQKLLELVSKLENI
jgi:DNA-binding MarR family transcriptional regulator